MNGSDECVFCLFWQDIDINCSDAMRVFLWQDSDVNGTDAVCVLCVFGRTAISNVVMQNHAMRVFYGRTAISIVEIPCVFFMAGQ